MVEGPGCTLKGEKMRGRMVGKAVKKVSGNAVQRAKKVKDGGGTVYDQLIGRKLEEVITLGKELFMFFGDICLRIHFLMAGSFRVNDVQLDNDNTKKADTSSLELDMDGDHLAFYKSAADIRDSKECREKYLELKDLDICSPIFNSKRAVAMVMQQTGRMVCDVLLDQVILPGVGNIIKNEALYDSGIRPNTRIDQLTEEHISLLVKMTRDFTMIFYKCRKVGKPLRPYEKVYHVGKCRQCGGKITTTRMGEDNPRVTYFCDSCQNNDLTRFQTQKSANKTSLLSWVSTGSMKKTEDWACSMCTLMNSGNQTNCSACLNPKIGNFNSTNQQKSEPNKTDTIPSQLEDFQQEKSVQTVVKKSGYTFRKRSLSNNSQLSMSGVSDSLPTKKARLSETSNILKTQNNNLNVIKKPNTIKKDDPQQGKTTPTPTQGEVIPSKIPLCPGHKRRCYMKQCWKENENRGRWFFVCSLPRAKQCNYFEWCDKRFPICEGHGKPCAFRTVMKEGPNNGRKFFACPLGKQKQCGFFEWALGYDES